MAGNKEEHINKKEDQHNDLMREDDTITGISIGIAKNDDENKEEEGIYEEGECGTAKTNEENGVLTSVEFGELLESQNDNNQNGEQESGPADEGRSR